MHAEVLVPVPSPSSAGLRWAPSRGLAALTCFSSLLKSLVTLSWAWCDNSSITCNKARHQLQRPVVAGTTPSLGSLVAVSGAPRGCGKGKKGLSQRQQASAPSPPASQATRQPAAGSRQA